MLPIFSSFFGPIPGALEVGGVRSAACGAMVGFPDDGDASSHRLDSVIIRNSSRDPQYCRSRPQA